MSSQDSSSRVITTTHLVKSEDLNHHQTLYGGRCVEWAVEMAYITAQNCFDESKSLVFISIRNLAMRTPARLGELVEYTGQIDYVGESTIGIRVDAHMLQPRNDAKVVVTGTFLFCTVDKDGKAVSHGLPELAPASTSAANRWKKAEKDIPLTTS